MQSKNLTEDQEELVRQRIKTVIDKLEKGIARRVAVKTGVTPNIFSEMFGKRGTKASVELLRKIADAYPEIRVEWLLKGEGEMLKSAKSDTQPEKSNIIRASHDGEAVSPAGTTNARHAHVMPRDFRVLPYLPVSARANFADHFPDEDEHKYLAEFQDSLAVLNVPMTSEYRHAFVVDVEGDSMEPTLRDGSKVVVTPVQRGNWQYLNKGVYCIIYGSNFVIKRIKDNTLMENGILRLHSDNPGAGSFPVKGDDIRAIWRVRFAAFVPIE